MARRVPGAAARRYSDAGKISSYNRGFCRKVSCFLKSCRGRQDFFLCQGGEPMLIIKSEIMDEAAMRRSLTRITHEIIERNRGTADLCIIGIRRRGAVLADILVLYPCSLA